MPSGTIGEWLEGAAARFCADEALVIPWPGLRLAEHGLLLQDKGRSHQLAASIGLVERFQNAVTGKARQHAIRAVEHQRRAAS